MIFRTLKYYKSSLSNLWKQMDFVKKEMGISWRKQLVELISLRPQGIHIEDYYKYALFDRKRIPKDQLKTYCGRDFKNEFRIFSDVQIQGIAFHKHIFYLLLDQFRLPHPTIYFLYCPNPNGFGRHMSISNRADLETSLLKKIPTPFFGKPSNASHGYGALGVLKIEGRTVYLMDNSEKVLDSYLDRIDEIAHRTGTYMFLEMIKPSEFFVEMSGSTLPSCRIIVLMKNGEPEIYKATILIPTEQKHVSNFAGGINHSISANINVMTGEMNRVISSPGPKMDFITHHPVSGKKIEGTKIPNWEMALQMIHQAAKAFSLFHMQHWDITFSPHGPKILELNFIGDIEPTQMHGPPGLMEDNFKNFYSEMKRKKGKN